MTVAEMSASRSRSLKWFGVAAGLLLLQIVILYFMDRIPICECGYVKLFEPGVNTPGNSQHLADWYTPSHIIHGFLFYWFAWLLFETSRFPCGFRLLFWWKRHGKSSKTRPSSLIVTVRRLWRLVTPATAS